ncbi:cation transporter [Candidatus Synechococcus spongiarum]|uniref:Cobalt-zinc-cadmium resistance protein CzcD n=1 Tax=Candidatus Synechococcus spongiarum TaxID=431041 RepID=A0A170TF11_9SYNE|nr:cation transporter [Candidatus Synechococcus spongiarum]CZB22095.1 Cobalt-zinc-cadmium resistance protein CzcD [Candidatus Synechococcus spongiarum]
MPRCCGHDTRFDGVSRDYKRRLWVVIVLNGLMFFLETTAGHMARSQALQADALDFLGDALTYAVSLAVIGASIQVRTNAAIAKGISLLLMGVWVFGATVYRIVAMGVPEADIMGIIGLLGLTTNVASVLVLAHYRQGDANVRSVWLCSRNDAIGNMAVMLAALGVWGTATGWPDLIVAAFMAGLFLSSSVQIIHQSLQERRQLSDRGGYGTLRAVSRQRRR